MGLFDKLKDAVSDTVASISDISPFGYVDGKKTSGGARSNQGYTRPSPPPAAPPHVAPPHVAPPSHSAPPPPAPPAPSQGVPRSGGSLYPQQLEMLIEVALADGEISERERQVLYKKAMECGIDLDEFEMVLEARLFEKRKADAAQAAAAAPPPAPAPAPAPVSPTHAPSAPSNKFGDVRKCPACGALIQSLSVKCAECGYEFRNAEANHGVQKLFEMLTEVDNQPTTSTGGFWGLFDEDRQDDNRIKRKQTIIMNFPIPTTKDDILEFLIMSVPQAKVSFFSSDKAANALASVWKSKCEQIIMKAKIVLRDDKETLDQIAVYAKELKINF